MNVKFSKETKLMLKLARYEKDVKKVNDNSDKS